MPEQSINDPEAGSYARKPRLRVLLDNEDIPGAISAQVQQNNYYQADRFTVDFALYANLDHGMKWWAQQAEMMLDVQMHDGTAWTSMVVGAVDQMTVNPDGGVVTVEGRDLSSRFIENRTQETFLNHTASEIAQTLAARRRLDAQVTATTTPVDRFYQADHTQISGGEFNRVRTEWDLLVWLAQHEGFDCFVKGRTLHFEPRIDPAQSPPWIARWQAKPGDGFPVSNVSRLRLQRSLFLSRDIEVVVRSWDSRHRRGFERKARPIGAKSANAQASSNQTGSPTQRYVFVRPNMTEAQAQAYANAQLEELSKHERVIEFDAPGDLLVTPRVMFALAGTGSDWDQRYFGDAVTFNIAFDAGLSMHVRAKNHATESEAIV